MSDNVNTQSASVNTISSKVPNENVMKKVKEVKTRIIQTSQLFKLLTKARSSLEDKEAETNNLKTSLDASIAAAQTSEQRIEDLIKQNESLSTQLLNTRKSSDLQDTVNNLQEQVKSLQNDKSNTDKVLNSNKMYISQLEAECESLKREITTKKKSDTNVKHKQEMAKKNEELKTLQEKVKSMESLDVEIKELREENNKLFDDNMELRINNELAMDIDDDEKEESNKEVVDTKNRVKELEEQLEDAKKHSDNLKNQLDRGKERYSMLNKEKNEKDQQIENLRSRYYTLNSEKLALQKTYDEHTIELKTKLMQSEGYRRSSSSSASNSGARRISSASSITRRHSPTAVDPEIVRKMQKWKVDNIRLKAENTFLKQQTKELTTRMIESRGINYLLESSSSDAEVDDNHSLSMSANSMEIDSPIMFNSPTQMFTSPVRSRSSGDNINMPISPLQLKSSIEHIPAKAGPSTAKTPRSMASLQSPILNKEKSAPPAQSSRRISESIVEIVDKPAYRATSGLIAPSSQVSSAATNSRKIVAPKGKSKKSKLIKFANSKNPSRLIVTRPNPIPVHTSSSIKAAVSPVEPIPKTPLESTAASPAKPVSERPVETTTTTVPAAPPVKPVSKRPLELATAAASSSKPVSKRPLELTTAASAVEQKEEEDQSKKQKLDTQYLSEIEKMIKSGKITFDNEIDKNQLNKYLEEIKLNYHRIKSPSDPDSKNVTTYGIRGQFTIDVPDKLDKKEKMYAWLLAYVSKEKKENYDYIIDALSQEITKGTTNKRMDVANTRYTRLICMVCKSMNGIETMRSLCYDILLRSACQNNAISCLINVAYVWKESLTIDENSSVTLRALQVCCAFIVKQDKTPNNVKVMYKKMADKSNWPDMENSISMEEFISQATNALLDLKVIDVDNYDKVLLHQKGFDFVKAFELVFTIFNDWKFLYNQFIVKEIYLMLSIDVVDVIAFELMGVLGSLGVSADPLTQNKPGVEHILKSLMKLVNLEGLLGEEEKELQIIAAKGALTLAYNNPIIVEKVNNLLKNNYINN